MAEIVYAAGVPHASGLVGLLGAAPDDVQRAVHGLFATLQDALRAARPDVLILFGNDHLANSRPRAYPDFLIGMAPVHEGPHPWYKEWLGCRDYEIRGSPAVAGALFRGLNRRGHRMHAQRENLHFDDNVSIPTVCMDLDRTDLALVPVLQNCTVPPLPDTRACYALGQSLASVIAHDLPAGLRVALLGSGGLSHEPGGARYGHIDRDFDLWLLELMASGDHDRLLRDLTVARMEQSGSGGTLELLSWVVVAGAVGPRYGTQTDYVLHTHFECGIGAVLWDLARSVAQPLPVRDPGPVTAEPTLLAPFDPSLASHDLVQDLKWDPRLRALFASNEPAVLDRYDLSSAERRALENRDFRALYAMGLHPYLGGQLARLLYGNVAGREANLAVQKLMDSLRSEAASAYTGSEGARVVAAG